FISTGKPAPLFLQVVDELGNSIGISRSGSPYNLDVRINGTTADTTDVPQPTNMTAFMSFKIEKTGSLFHIFYDPLGGDDYLPYGNADGYALNDIGSQFYLELISAGQTT